MATNDTDTAARIQALLTEASETHHRVYRLTDGADDDWASWYSDWLTNHSELPDLLRAKLVRSELTWLLVRLGKEVAERQPPEPWEQYYAKAIVEHFTPA
jgi:hypothetical protein